MTESKRQPGKGKTETVVFGGGCFWCTQAVFDMLNGIVKTMPGYAGGTMPNPTYKQVCDGNTGHAEVLQIEYDPRIITFDALLNVFFEMHDPTSLNRQGADHGSQYRSIILYTTEKQHATAVRFIKNLQRDFEKRIVTEIIKLKKFYPAEEYHKDYYKKNPLQPYCIFAVRSNVGKIRKKFKDLLK